MIQIKDNTVIISSNDCPKRRDEVAILEAFASVIKTAVTKRMSSCTADFKKHVSNLVYISEEHCEYFKEDGSIAYYNPYSIRRMNQILSLIDSKDYYSILADSFMCNQIVKALVSYYTCPESLQTKYDDLIAVLLDHIMQQDN